MRTEDSLRKLAIDDLLQAILHSRYPATERAVDSLKAYILSCVEHDDASRHDPEGL